jgi:hypothetical protein
MAGEWKKTLELAFAIGGSLSPSFRQATGQSAAEIAKLVHKSEQAMKHVKLQKEFEQKLDNFKKKASEMGAAWKGVVDSIVGLIKEIAVLGGIAGAAVYGLAAKTAQMGDNAVKGASKMGVTVQQYGEMAFAASQSGLSVEQFTGNMTKMNTIMAKAYADGKKDVYIHGKRLMTIKDENGKLKGRTRLLLETADVFNKLTDENQKLTLATIMFGKSGADMIPMLESGRAGIQKLMGDADRLGVVFDDVSGQRAVAFGDSLGELKAAAQGLAISIGKQLHEPLTRVNEAITGWVVRNRELIAQKVGEFVQDIVKWVKENKEGIIGLGESIKGAIVQFGKWIEKNGGLIEVLKKVGKAFIAFKALGVVFAIMNAVAATAIFAGSLLQLILAAKGVLATFGGFKVVVGIIAGAAAPVAAIVAAVISLGVAAYLLLKHWDGVVYFFKNLATTVPIFFSDLVEDIKDLFGKLPDWLQNIISPIKNIIVGPIEAIQSLLAGDFLGFFMGLGKSLFNYLYTIPLMIAQAGNEIIKAIFGVDIIKAVKDWIGPAIDTLWGVLDTGIGAIADFLVGEFNQLVGAFGGGFINGISAVLAFIPNLVVKGINGIIKAIIGIDLIAVATEWIQGFVNGLIGRIKGAASAVRDAVKGIIPKVGGMFGAMKESVKNVVGTISSDFVRLYDNIAGYATRMNDAIMAATGVNILGTVAGWYGDMVSTVSGWLTQLFDVASGVFDRIKGVFAGVGEFLKGFFLGELMSIKEAFSGGFLKGIGEIFHRLATLIPRLLQDATKAIMGIDLVATGKDWIQRFIDGVMSALKGATGAVRDAVKGMIPESVLNVVGSATKAVSGVMNTVGGAAKSVVKSLPMFGEGGIATGPSIVAEDGKPEAVIPLTKPNRAIELIKMIMPKLPMPEMQTLKASVPELPEPPELFGQGTQAQPSPLEILKGVTNNNSKTNNIGGSTVNVTNNINVTGGGSSNVSASIKEAGDALMDKMRANIEKWFMDMQRNNMRVSMS